MTTHEIGIVGLGYVGTAIYEAYKEKNQLYRVHTFDINQETLPTYSTLEELVRSSFIIYVCVPTPMKRDGTCDVSIVEKVIHDIDEIATEQKIVVIKSTIPPGTTENIQQIYKQHYIVFNPEFLTEANYIQDFRNQELLVVGTRKHDVGQLVIDEQRLITHNEHAIITTPTTAEFYKYIANIFLAVKVSFSNEVCSVANILNVEWEEVSKMLVLDSRMGKTHWKVPGPDGHRGFGGTCLPKDLEAFVHLTKTLDVQTPILNSVLYRNKEIDRPERDWELLKGRAVT